MRFQNPIKHLRKKVLHENLKIKYFRKTLHRRCLAGFQKRSLYWTHSAYYFIVFIVNFEHVYDQRGSWLPVIYNLKTYAHLGKFLKYKFSHKQLVLCGFWYCFCKVCHCVKSIRVRRFSGSLFLTFGLYSVTTMILAFSGLSTFWNCFHSPTSVNGSPYKPLRN